MTFGAVILAAGYSSRMVEFKPLMRLGGKSLTRHCVELFETAGIEKIFVVTGHRGEEVEREVRETGAVSIRNPDYDSGMYSSICAPLELLKKVEGFFLLPVDIPLIRPATLQLMVKTCEGGRVLFPCFDGDRGHPPYIPSCYIPEILSYNGDGGLKKLLETFSAKDVDVWDQAVLMDMDTGNDFTRLKKHRARMDTGTRGEAEALALSSMPERIVAHGRGVAAVAVLMGEELNRSGSILDLDLLHNAGLLHDIAKGQPDHERRGAELLAALGLAGLSECVGRHRDAVPPESGKLTEVELVCLADKLARGAKQVTVYERFEEKLCLYKDDKVACEVILKRMANALGLQELVEQQCGKPLGEILQQEVPL